MIDSGDLGGRKGLTWVADPSRPADVCRWARVGTQSIRGMEGARDTMGQGALQDEVWDMTRRVWGEIRAAFQIAIAGRRTRNGADKSRREESRGAGEATRGLKIKAKQRHLTPSSINASIDAESGTDVLGVVVVGRSSKEPATRWLS